MGNGYVIHFGCNRLDLNKAAGQSKADLHVMRRADSDAFTDVS